MKVFKKIAAVAAALVMTMAMSVAPFAADYAGQAVETGDTTLNIPKVLTVKNPTLASVDGPGLTYSYEIASVTPAADNGGTSITDAAGHTATVKAGPADGASLTTASVSWPVGTAVNASADGTDNTKNITASVDLTKFASAGIYRYQITEANADSLAGGRVTDEDAAEVRYLDVYIENAENPAQGEPAVAVAGYKLHDGTTKPATDPAQDGKTRPASARSFDPSEFDTVNITLAKNVTGSLGDKQNQFPFAGTIVDGGRFFYAKKAEAPTAVDDNKIAGAAAGSAISTTLAHGETYYIAGLSKVATAAYTETNNTADTYTVSINGEDSGAVAANGTKAMNATTVTADMATVFTNNLDSVSPTGVVLRFGAPLLVLAAAIALVALNKKAKTSEN